MSIRPVGLVIIILKQNFLKYQIFIKVVPVPYDDLPVVLPKVSELTGKGASPLSKEKEWLKAKCQGYHSLFKSFKPLTKMTIVCN